MGKHLVTTAEVAAFFAGDGYSNDAHWSEAGKHWRDTRRTMWPDLAASRFGTAGDPQSARRRLDVVRGGGVCHGPWVPLADPRRALVRHARGYQPSLSMGSALWTRQRQHVRRSLGKPSAVGLFLGDCTPEGVYDLAGNVAEWTPIKPMMK